MGDYSVINCVHMRKQNQALISHLVGFDCMVLLFHPMSGCSGC